MLVWALYMGIIFADGHEEYAGGTYSWTYNSQQECQQYRQSMEAHLSGLYARSGKPHFFCKQVKQ